MSEGGLGLNLLHKKKTNNFQLWFDLTCEDLAFILFDFGFGVWPFLLEGVAFCCCSSCRMGSLHPFFSEKFIDVSAGSDCLGSIGSHSLFWKLGGGTRCFSIKKMVAVGLTINFRSLPISLSS